MPLSAPVSLGDAFFLQSNIAEKVWGMSHKLSDRPHSLWCRIVSRQGDEMNQAMADEGQTIVRRAAGDTSGMTVAAQIRKAERALGYKDNSWRIREAWYGRAGCWSAAAMCQLQAAYVRWWEREQHRVDSERRTQAATDRALLQKLRDQHAAELQRLNARLALLDGDPS